MFPSVLRKDLPLQQSLSSGDLRGRRGVRIRRRHKGQTITVL